MDGRGKARLRFLGTVATSLVHFYMAFLGFIGRLNYTVDSRYVWVEQIARADYWAVIHLIAGATLVAGLHFQRHEGKALSWSWAVMLTWTVFNMLWALTTVRAVSLVAPGLAAFVALGAFVLSRSWDATPITKAHADEG